MTRFRGKLMSCSSFLPSLLLFVFVSLSFFFFLSLSSSLTLFIHFPVASAKQTEKCKHRILFTSPLTTASPCNVASVRVLFCSTDTHRLSSHLHSPKHTHTESHPRRKGERSTHSQASKGFADACNACCNHLTNQRVI